MPTNFRDTKSTQFHKEKTYFIWWSPSGQTGMWLISKENESRYQLINPTSKKHNIGQPVVLNILRTVESNILWFKMSFIVHYDYNNSAASVTTYFIHQCNPSKWQIVSQSQIAVVKILGSCIGGLRFKNFYFPLQSFYWPFQSACHSESTWNYMCTS